jgi:hypothetical protein
LSDAYIEIIGRTKVVSNFPFIFRLICGTIPLWNMERDSEEGMKDMEEVLRFVGKMTKQTEEDLAFQRRSEPEDEWVKFLEGRLQAFKLVQGFVEDLQSRRVRLH